MRGLAIHIFEITDAISETTDLHARRDKQLPGKDFQGLKSDQQDFSCV
jgi:hypothetical protein